MGLMCFVGYIFLVLFGGVGLIALPLDLMKQFSARPIFVYIITSTYILIEVIS
jgi:LMBR1 domain-containing protein 1